MCIFPTAVRCSTPLLDADKGLQCKNPELKYTDFFINSELDGGGQEPMATQTNHSYPKQL